MTELRRQDAVQLPTAWGEFTLVPYVEAQSGLCHVALVCGRATGDPPPLVRLHSECLTGDVFGSQRCDCGSQLQAALRRIAREGQGVLVYLRQEGRGIGLANKLLAYALQDQGLDTVDANRALGFPDDARDYGIAVTVLRDLGIGSLRLLTNNPRKVEALAAAGFAVKRVPLQVPAVAANRRYLETKATRLGHLLPAAP